MAIAIKLQGPTGTVYDLSTGKHGFITVGLPDQSKQLEQDFAQVTSGEQAVTFRNDDGWFDTAWPLPMDPEQHFFEATGLGCWSLLLYKNGAVSWVGDLDVRSVEFDPKLKTVSANFLGKVKRLEYFNADKVRRPIPQLYDGGTGTGSLNSFAATTVDNYAANDLVNHVLVDSASNGFAITANAATVAGVTVLTIVGTPASGTYNIRPFGLKWVVATGGGYNRRHLDSLVDISTLQLVPGDVIKISKFKHNGKVLQQELEIQDTHATDATLPTNRLRFKRRLKGQYDYTSATACTTPYYRNLSPATLAGLIYDHCGIDAAHREINITAFSTSNLVPYFNTNGKNCAEALCELAVITGSTHFATPATYFFLSLDQSKAAVTPKTIDTLVLDEKWQGLWEKFFNFITATGSKDGQYARIGGLVYPENKLDISTDYVNSVSWLQQIVERAYTMWGVRRKPGNLTLKDDGTIYEIWDEVIRSGVTYRVIGVQEPMRAVEAAYPSTITITVIAKVGTAATTGNGETQDEAIDDSDPPPPTDLEVYKVDGTEPAMFRTLYPEADYKSHCKSAPVLLSVGPPIQFGQYQRRLQCIRFKWDQDDLRGRLFGFHLKKWRDGENPDKPIGQDNWEDPQEATDGWYYFKPGIADDGSGGPTYNRVGKKSWYAIQVALEDGRLSAYCDEVATGTESGDGDPDTPTAPTFTSVSSPVDDIASTPKKECTAIVTVGITASTSKQKVRVYITDTTTGKQFSQAVKAAYADTSAVVTFRRMFRKDDACHIDRIEVENNGQSAVLDLTAPTGNFTAGSTAALSVTATATPKSGAPTLAVTFGSTPSGGTPGYTYDWDYGDGSAHGTTQNPSHNYTVEGTFLAIVTVSDSAGQVAQAIVPVQVYTGGAPGADAVTVGVVPSNGVAWSRATNAGAWTPAGTTTDLVFTFYRAGASVAVRTVRATLTTSSGIVTFTSVSHTGETTTETFVNNGSTAACATIAHTASGASLAQSVISNQGGNDGAAGANGTNGMGVYHAFHTNDPATTPTKPADTWAGQDGGAGANGWTLNPAAGTVYNWMCYRASSSDPAYAPYSGSGFTPASQAWTTPQRWNNTYPPPAAATLTSIYSPADDIPGTAGKEATAEVTVGLPGANETEVQVEILDNSKGKYRHESYPLGGSETSAVAQFRKEFKVGASCTVTRLRVFNHGIFTDTIPSSGQNFTAGGSLPTMAADPTLERKKNGDHRNKYKVTMADASATTKIQRTIEMFSAPGGSAAATFANWATSTGYTGHATETAGDSIVFGATAYQYYRCILSHTSGASTEPGVGASWETYWELRCSPDAAGGAVWEPEPERDISIGAKQGKKFWFFNIHKDLHENIAAAIRLEDIYGRGTHLVYHNASGGATPLSVAFGTVAYSGLAVDFGTITPAGGTANYTYDLDWGDGTAHATGGAAASWDPASHTYAAAGSYVCLLTVTDAVGAVATVQTIVTVPNSAGTFVATLSATPTYGAPTLAVSFTVGQTGGSGSPTYDLDYGDGTSHGTASGSHNYTAIGTYTATLVVTDALGARAQTTVTITVANAVASLSAKNCGTAAGTSWTNPTYAQGAENGTVAYFNIPDSLGSSNLFSMTNYSFAIPTGATIDGIVVRMKAKAAVNNKVTDLSVQIIKGGTAGGTDLGGSYVLTSALAWYQWGSETNLWGNTLAASDINASNFGVAATFENSDSAYRTVSIDCIVVTIYYH